MTSLPLILTLLAPSAQAYDLGGAAAGPDENIGSWSDYFQPGLRDAQGVPAAGSAALTLYRQALSDMQRGWQVPATWHDYLKRQARVETMTAPPPNFSAGQSAAELTRAADATKDELAYYYRKFLAPSLPMGDPAKKELYEILSAAHAQLGRGTQALWKSVDAAVGEVAEGYRIAAAMGVVVSGNKESVGLTLEAAAEMKASVEAMRPEAPAPGEEIDVDILGQVLAAVAAEEAFTRTIAERLGEMEERLAALTPEEALRHLAWIDGVFGYISAVEDGMHAGVNRDGVAAGTVKGKGLAMAFTRGEMRDAPADVKKTADSYQAKTAAAKDAGETAVFKTRMAKDAVDAAVEALEEARRRIEVCTAMQKTAATTAEEEAEKINQVNEKLEQLAGGYAAALASGDAAQSARIAAEAKSEIAKAEQSGERTEQAGRAAGMANVAAMEGLADAVAALRYASALVGRAG